jgi:hypothetical protein
MTSSCGILMASLGMEMVVGTSSDIAGASER